MKRCHLLLLLLLLFAVGCTDKRTPEEMKDTLVYGYGDNFKTFDPTRQVYAQEGAIITQVLEPLVFWDQNLQLVPRLATSWDTPDECRTWIFHLRKGVKFHDGTPFNAEAVKAHFERTKDPQVAATRAHLITEVNRIEARDEYTVVFHLDQANSVFPERLASTFGSIPSPTAVKKLGKDFARNPVGTGPFKFVEWVRDEKIVLEKNENHWNVDAYFLKRLIFKPVPENTTRLILLEQGVLDIADVYYAHVNVAKESDDIVVESMPQLSIRYIGFNTQKPPFNNKKVRQAANYAINKKDMIKYMFFGVGEPAYGPFPSVLPDYNPNIRHYDYDPEKARELLAEAGYPNGFDVTLWTTETGTYRNTAEAAVEYLRNVGINIEMKILDNGAYWGKFDEYLTRNGDMYPTKEGVYDIYIAGWVGGETAHGFLEPLFKKGSYSNSSFYDNSEVNELLDEYKRVASTEGRRKIFQKIQEIVVEDAPWIFAFHGQANVGVRKRVKGFQINGAGWYFFDGVKVVDHERMEDMIVKNKMGAAE